MSMDADAAAANKKTKLLNCLKAIFIPTSYGKSPCRSLKTASIVLCLAYILSVICTLSAVKALAVHIYDDATELLAETDNFYMHDFKLFYDGQSYEGYIESLGLTVRLDQSIDPPDTVETATVWFGPHKAAIFTDIFSYSIEYSSLASRPEDMEFDKEFIVSELSYGKTVMLNLLYSTSILVTTVLAAVLMLLVLLLSVLVYGLCKGFNVSLSFEQRAFVSVASLIYPLLINAVLFIIPKGVTLLIGSFDVVLRLFAAMILLYIVVVLMSFGKPERTNQ